jgi:hypothetical protein
MERQQVIDVRVPLGSGGPASGTLLLEERPPVVAEATAPPLVPPGSVRLWAWRMTVAFAVLLVVAGLLAFASSPPPV